jgi:hypothetical protein
MQPANRLCSALGHFLCSWYGLKKYNFENSDL